VEGKLSPTPYQTLAPALATTKNGKKVSSSWD